VRVAARAVWAPVYVLGLRLRVAIWGAAALEHAVATRAPWLALEILRAYGVTIGPGLDFHGRLQLHGAYEMAGKLSIGAYCHIGPGVTLDLTGPVRLEDRCTVALDARILTHHDVGYSPLGRAAYPTRVAGVVVEPGAFVGAGATVLAGVRVGRCSVIGAGAVVTGDVPPYTVVAGAPARVIRRLDPLGLE
jgi:acetyltransferase-like isoleucine patch superfamily enzyme